MSLSALNHNPPAHVAGPHEYKAPGPADVRSPCPFLNTMANHGYINRSGRYITLWAATKGMMECYNFDFSLALFVASAGIYTSLFTSLNPFWFNLDELLAHNGISVEHDASLTRQDKSTGDNHTPDPKLIEGLISQASSPDGVSYEDLAQWRIEREKTLPEPLVGGRSYLATGEIGLIIPAIGRGDFDALGRRIHPDWAESFFGPGKLPDDWVRQQTPVTLKHVDSIRAAVQERMKNLRAAGKTK